LLTGCYDTDIMAQHTRSYHLTRRIAEHHAAKAEANLKAGRSSGNQRIDILVKRSARPFRRWRVVERSI
jgi:hypothetical protein